MTLFTVRGSDLVVVCSLWQTELAQITKSVQLCSFVMRVLFGVFDRSALRGGGCKSRKENCHPCEMQ